jgi:hypothetical protein
MQNLAPKYGVSDVGLAKACRKLHIPLPGRGYWAKKAAGKSVPERLPLPGVEVRAAGRIAAQTPEAQARRAETQRRQITARLAWKSSNQPAWLNEETYIQKIQPRLAEVTVSAIASVLKVSEPYASDIRAGRCHPHPRHWQALAALAGVSPDASQHS